MVFITQLINMSYISGFYNNVSNIGYKISNNFSESYYVVGDIHGNFQALEDYYNTFMRLRHDKNNSNMKMILLGDYIDRGSESSKCLDFIEYLQNKSPLKDSIVFLLGNHEVFRYANCVTEDDPTRDADNRLSYYNKRGLKFLYAYYNTVQKVLFTHSGMKYTENISGQCFETIYNLSRIKTFNVNGDSKYSLDSADNSIHNHLFYPLVEHYTDTIEDGLKNRTRNAGNIVQVMGHYHSVAVKCNKGITSEVSSIRNLQNDSVSYIVIDPSDDPSRRCSLVIYDNGDMKWF